MTEPQFLPSFVQGIHGKHSTLDHPDGVGRHVARVLTPLDGEGVVPSEQRLQQIPNVGLVGHAKLFNGAWPNALHELRVGPVAQLAILLPGFRADVHRPVIRTPPWQTNRSVVADSFQERFLRRQIVSSVLLCDCIAMRQVKFFEPRFRHNPELIIDIVD